MSSIQELWSESLGDPEVRVAILDGPVDSAHACFAGAQLITVPTLAAKAPDQGPATFHGTHVASIIFGQHGSPVRGVAPRCTGLIAPVFADGSDGTIQLCTQLDLARAITQALALGAHVINISAGEFRQWGAAEAEPLLTSAIQRSVEQGVIIVAAAGNDGSPSVHIPAGLPGVLVVGAMDAKGEPLAFSNWEAGNDLAGVVAQGNDVEGAVPFGGTVRRSGTSFATAHVSGVVALLLSIQRKKGIESDARAVQEAIIRSAAGCDVQQTSDCRRLLRGRLNPIGALRLLQREKRLAPLDQRGTEKRKGISVMESTTTAEEMTSLGAPQANELTPAPGSAAVQPLSCSCQGKPPATAESDNAGLVYALGELGYDFGTEARRDSVAQEMDLNPHDESPGPNPDDPTQFLAYLKRCPWSASSVIWTLNLDATAIYAIDPSFHPFASIAYERFREFLEGQLRGAIERVSVPGVVAGRKTLLRGQTVPVVWPDVRGLYSWTTEALVKAVRDSKGAKKKDGLEEAEVANFLERVYYEVRNLGIAPQERAVNYAATNAFQLTFIYERALMENLKLDTIEVEKSPICRPQSDCWDVKLTFFNPGKRLEAARVVYRFTVDVSDVLPVIVGKVRHWHIY